VADVNTDVPAGYMQQVIPGPALLRASRQPIYDTAIMPVGVAATQVTFFQTPLGQAGKTIHDTNLETAGQLPSPNQFLFTGLGFSVQRGIAPLDFNALYEMSELEFLMGSTPYVQVPLESIPTVGGATGFAATTAGATTISQVCNGVPLVNNVFPVAFKSKKYILITSSETFRIVLSWKAAITPTANIRLRAWMFGIFGTPMR